MIFRSISEVFYRKINKKPCLYQQGQIFYMECLISELEALFEVPQDLLREPADYSMDERFLHWF